MPGRAGARSRPIGSDGLFACERQILELSDAGTSPEEIARLTKKSEGYVRQTIANYAVTGKNPFAASASQGSAALLAAIQRYHPDVCAPEPRP